MYFRLLCTLVSLTQYLIMMVSELVLWHNVPQGEGRMSMGTG